MRPCGGVSSDDVAGEGKNPFCGVVGGKFDDIKLSVRNAASARFRIALLSKY